MKTKHIIIIIAAMLLSAMSAKAQYIWSYQLYEPDNGSTTVPSTANMFYLEVYPKGSDVDFDSVEDNFDTAFMLNGIDWIEMSGSFYNPNGSYTLIFSISTNYGRERTVYLGTEDYCHEVVQEPYGPPIPVDGSRNWMTTVSYNSLNENVEQPVYDISYFDGLGYENQAIQIGASVDGCSLVTPHSFDAFHRETNKWLPFPYDTEGEAIDDPVYEQASWYGNEYSSEDSNYTSYEDCLEAATSGRKTSSYIPGYDMADNYSEYEYRTNEASDSLLCFSADQFTGILTCSGYYTSGTLRGEVSYDGDRHQSTTWTDSEGRTIRVDGWDATAGRVSTSYAYDLRGNLCWVISPEGVEGYRTELSGRPVISRYILLPADIRCCIKMVLCLYP